MAENYRRQILDALIPYFEKDGRFFLLIADMGFGAIDKFKERFPDRYRNVGIAEQASVSIAAGLAMSGLRPIYYSIVNFLVFRALEQIRNDIVLQELNVKLIGTGANGYFHQLGYSHTCERDDVMLMRLIGMPVYDASRPLYNFELTVDNWIRNSSYGYIRV